jgi:4-amino-4-deoxy-L-arabinose transferase-like glycosyltransferase
MLFEKSMMRIHSTLPLLLLVAFLVVSVRAAVLLVDTTQARIADDVDCYLEIARNLVAGKGYTLTACRMSDAPLPTAMRGPTVVYFFTAILWLFGDHFWSIVLAQWVVDVCTSILLFFIVMEIFHDRRIAFVACLLFAFYEPGLIFTFRGWSEPMFTLVLAAFTLSLLRLLRSPSTSRFVLCGFLLGVAVLARPVMEFYPLVIFPLLWWASKPRWRLFLPKFAVFSLTFAAVLLPWIVRNYVVFNAFIPGSTHSGAPFYEGNFALDQPDYLRHRGTEETAIPLWKALEARFGPLPNNLALSNVTIQKIRDKEVDPVAIYAKAKGLNEFQLNQFAFQEGMKVVRTYPARYVLVSIVRFLRVWFHHRFVAYLILGGRLPRAWLVAAINGALLGFAAIAFMWRQGAWVRPAVVSLIVLVVYNSAIYAATNAVGRYSVPIIPYVMVFAAFTVVQLLPKWAKQTVC